MHASPRRSMIFLILCCSVVGFSGCPPEDGQAKSNKESALGDDHAWERQDVDRIVNHGSIPRVERLFDGKTLRGKVEEATKRALWTEAKKFGFVMANNRSRATTAAFSYRGRAYYSQDEGLTWTMWPLGKWDQFPVTRIAKNCFVEGSVCLVVDRNKER